MNAEILIGEEIDGHLNNGMQRTIRLINEQTDTIMLKYYRDTLQTGLVPRIELSCKFYRRSIPITTTKHR